jgi:hypothetical protein
MNFKITLLRNIILQTLVDIKLLPAFSLYAEQFRTVLEQQANPNYELKQVRLKLKQMDRKLFEAVITQTRKLSPAADGGGPQFCETSRFTYFPDNGITDGGGVVCLTCKLPCPQRRIQWREEWRLLGCYAVWLL